MNAEYFKKVRLAAGKPLLALNAPADFLSAFTAATGGKADTTPKKAGSYEVVQLFVHSVAELEEFAPLALKALVSDGYFWIAFPKKSSGMQTDLSRDEGWQLLTRHDWDPVTVISMDENWSSLRFRKHEHIKVMTRSRQARVLAGAATKTVRKPIAVPADLQNALEARPNAWKIFEAFAYTHRKEYVAWVSEAKRDDTRERRIAKAVDMIGAGKKFS